MKNTKLGIQWINARFISIEDKASIDRVLLLVEALNPKWIVVKNRRSYYLLEIVELQRELKRISKLDTQQPISLTLENSYRAEVVKPDLRAFTAGRAVAVDANGRVSRIARIHAISRSSGSRPRITRKVRP